MAIEINGLEVALGRLDLFTDINRVEKGLTMATLLVERAAKQKAPKGELQQSITSKVQDLKGTVGTPLYYAPYVEYGTGIYSIHPKGGRKEVPWVYVEGQVNENPQKTVHTLESAKEAAAFLESKGLNAVITYGSKPQPYLRPALDENREEILRILGEALLND
jgi:HK97 gp10 family phage protein